MSQALYRKWRPARFDEVIGQQHVTRTLQHSVAAGRVGHAYLLCGPRGTGKTTTARLVAKAVNCLHEDQANRPCNECSICIAINEARFLDLIEIDAASNTGVDDIRDLRDKINFLPSEGRLKVYIIDEVHMLSPAAFNALLKTLEEPPPHAMFVLATTEEHKVPLTIKSRCQQFNFRLFTDAEIKGRLEWLAEKESLEIAPDAASLIARQAGGSLRDAESLLDQLMVAPGDVLTSERVRSILGTATDAAVATLTDAWLNGDGAKGLDVIHEALASGTDARQFCRQMVAYLRRLLLLQAAGPNIVLDGPADRNEEMSEQAQQAPRKILIEAIKHFNDAALTPSRSWQPQLPLELAFIQLLPESPAPSERESQAIATQTPKPDLETELLGEAEPESPPPMRPESAEGAIAPSTELEEDATQQTVEAVVERVPHTDQGLSLAVVKTRWQDTLSQVGNQNKNLPALLNMGKPLAIEGNMLILGFDYPIFKEKFDNTAGGAELIGEILSNLLNIKCNVRGVVTSEYPIIVTKEEFHAVAQELGGVVREELGEDDG
jgi:DNA polymerase-3 subunit gamma/tau